MFRLRITGDIGFEYWADIPGYEGYYQSSTYGRVLSLKYNHADNNPKILKQSTIRGYLAVNLYKDGKMKTFKVHRLIALTFLPKFNTDFNEINHKSEVKTENQVWNLEWCDCKYNVNYGTAIKRRAKNRTTTTQLDKKKRKSEYSKQYRLKHLDSLRKYSKDYRNNHKEELSIKQKERYKTLTNEQREKINRQARERYERNKQKIVGGSAAVKSPKESVQRV